MTPEQKRTNLKIIYTYKFDGPHCEDISKDTDIAIINFINSFLRNCKHLLKMNYSIIIEYNNSIYDYLTYRLVSNALPLTTVKPEINILGVCNSPEEQALFKNVQFIGKKKAKKIKRAVYITGHHPIYNVKNLNDVSKQFSTVINPLERFSPPQMNQLIHYYVEKKNPLFTTIDEDNSLYRFYQFPVGLKDFDDLPTTKTPKAVYLFKLSGTEDDFKCYDFILEKADKEPDSIFLYLVPSDDAAAYTELNLIPYLPRHLVPNKFNVITNKNEILHPTQTYNYTEFMEGEE